MIFSTGKLLDYRDFRKYSDTFIETGSGHGDGIQRALDAGFSKVVSLEAYTPNYLVCVGRFGNIDRVHLYLANSQENLGEILDYYPGVNVIFLDAHPSGENSAGHKEIMQGNMEFSQDAIIRKELSLILPKYERHALILDDICGNIGGLAEDYARLISEAKPDYQFFFYNENLSGSDPAFFYKDKLLVAVPGEVGS